MALSTRFDIHADSARGTADAFCLGVQYVEIDKMNKIPLAVAVALVLGTPLAFAGSDANLPSPAAMTTLHCPNIETPSPIDAGAMNYSSAKQQAAEEEALSLCRQDRHKRGGEGVATKTTTRPGTGTSPSPVLLVHR